MRALGELTHLLAAGDGVVLVREHPQLKDVLHRQSGEGLLRAVLPGVYVPAGLVADPMTMMRAVARWDPDAVLTGAAAARVSFWPEIKLTQIDVAVRSQRRPQCGFAFRCRRIPVELVDTRRGLRYASPSLTALELSDLDHTDAIDTALRTRAATLDSLHQALRLTPHRAGNADVRRLLIDSRDEPWSRAEREAHRLLRRHHVTGWRSNVPFWHLGCLYYIDIAFESLRLAIEIDGRFHEDDPNVFEADRWRQNALVLSGWRVLRFTWPMVRDHPEQFVQTVRRGMRARQNQHERAMPPQIVAAAAR